MGMLEKTKQSKFGHIVQLDKEGQEWYGFTVHGWITEISQVDWYAISDSTEEEIMNNIPKYSYSFVYEWMHWVPSEHWSDYTMVCFTHDQAWTPKKGWFKCTQVHATEKVK